MTPKSPIKLILQTHLGGTRGVRRLFPAGMISRQMVMDWTKRDTMPAWAIRRLCKAAQVPVEDVLYYLEEKEMGKRGK